MNKILRTALGLSVAGAVATTGLVGVASAASAEAQSTCRYTIGKSDVNIRSGPGLKYHASGKFKKTRTAPIFATCKGKKGWVKVKQPKWAQNGWVAKNLLDRM